jgi:hypothetical protein
MHEIQEIARDIAIRIRHRLPPPADRDRDIVIVQQHLRPTARVRGIARDHIGAVDGARAVIALDPHHLVGAFGAVDHRDRPLKALPAQMLLAQFAEPDPRLPRKAAAGEMDP